MTAAAATLEVAFLVVLVGVLLFVALTLNSARPNVRAAEFVTASVALCLAFLAACVYAHTSWWRCAAGWAVMVCSCRVARQLSFRVYYRRRAAGRPRGGSGRAVLEWLGLPAPGVRRGRRAASVADTPDRRNSHG